MSLLWAEMRFLAFLFVYFRFPFCVLLTNYGRQNYSSYTFHRDKFYNNIYEQNLAELRFLKFPFNQNRKYNNYLSIVTSLAIFRMILFSFSSSLSPLPPKASIISLSYFSEYLDSLFSQP